LLILYLATLAIELKHENMRLTNQEVEAKIAEAIESNATTFSLDDRLLTHIPDSNTSRLSSKQC
jgi:hypothetical protein